MDLERLPLLGNCQLSKPTKAEPVFYMDEKNPTRDSLSVYNTKQQKLWTCLAMADGSEDPYIEKYTQKSALSRFFSIYG